MEESAFNPEGRRLCPDGTCVGLLGDDGRCRVCGLRADASTPGDRSTDELLAGAAADDDDDDHADADDEADRSEAAGAGGGGDEVRLSASSGGFRPDRRLCDDGSCIGVVDASGVCSVCGRRAG
jgi:hypothetical protein